MRSPKKKPFSESRKHSKYKVTNWPEYNNILRKRGRIDFMIAENLSNAWYENSPNNRKVGRQRIYSDIAILQCLQIRYLFGLKLRQTQGFINWIFEMAGFKLRCPDYTTLSIRAKKLNITLLNKNYDKEFNHVIIDSTGIQTYTGNEWLENKHGKQYIRRIWKKLHIMIDEDGQIIANQAWRVKNNYGRREKVENTFFRFKNTFGSKFLSRNDKNMKNELSIKCQLLNKMFEIGKPISTSIF